MPDYAVTFWRDAFTKITSPGRTRASTIETAPAESAENSASIPAARWETLIAEQRAEWGPTNRDVAVALGETYTRLRLDGQELVYANGVWRMPPHPPVGEARRFRDGPGPVQ